MHLNRPPRPALPILLLAVIASVSCQGDSRAGAAGADQVAAITSIYAVTMSGLDGQPYDFAQLKGKVVVLVNVASRCHFTPQYQALEALYRRYQERGLVVIGVPANDFFGQEPGTNQDIQQFCSATYQVTFPMMAKVAVTGDERCPLYRYLTTASPKPGAIGWNFIKFVVDRQGQVVERFGSFTAPDDAAVIALIEKLLG
jgi:glutathione peroxidase